MAQRPHRYGQPVINGQEPEVLEIVWIFVLNFMHKLRIKWMFLTIFHGINQGVSSHLKGSLEPFFL